MTLVGRWALQLWVETGDIVRVIGTFCKENEFHLKMDDNYDETDEKIKIGKASMVIVEPHIMIPTTQIVKAFPCTRKAYLSNQCKGIHGDINHALVLGNVIHSIFQEILAQMDFRRETISKIIKDAIRSQLLLLFSLQKNEKEVEEDARKAVKNITEWLDMVLLPHKNKFGLKFVKFIAAEQEFNTQTYGIKGNIDGTLVMRDKDGKEFSTALEIKTGKHHQVSYRGQVMIYSLLISERFLNANPDNILLYIMENPVRDGFEFLKQ